jgi:prepilin-type N-terminal cleavage/methylation domain-containing protein
MVFLANNNKGLTLVEVMIALSVFLLVFMGLFQTALLSIEHNMKNILRDEAINIAAARMEETKSMPFDSVINNPNVCSVSNNLCTVADECPQTGESCGTPTTVSLPSCATTTYPMGTLRDFRNIQDFPFGTEIAVIDYDADTKQIDIEVAWEYKNECYTHSITSLRRR